MTSHPVPATERPSLRSLLDPGRQADPYPLYRSWRTQDPIAQPAERFFILSRHDDCSAVLRDPRFGHTEPGEETLNPREAVLVDDDGRPVRGFLSLNPPDHTRLRSLVAQAFTRRRVEALAPRIEEISSRLVSSMTAGDGSADLIEDLATPMPVAVISELLGVPEADRDRMLSWSHSVARALIPGFLLSAEAITQEAQARREFAAFLRELVAERRVTPGDDLLSALVHVHDNGDVLSENELLATCTLLLIAGHETTVNLIGNGMLALLRHPDQLAALRRDPDLMAPAVEELLRYDSPVQLTVRFALQDASVGDIPVPQGSAVVLMIGAANRDPEAHRDPDRLDISRSSERHLSFGHGIHFCIGAPLARLEAQIALRTLLDRAPHIRLAGEPSWKDNITLRGLSSLPVAFG